MALALAASVAGLPAAAEAAAPDRMVVDMLLKTCSAMPASPEELVSHS